MPADGRSSAGLLPSLPGYAEIVTHSGITLGALLARLVAEEITTGTVDPLLAPFRPERFG
jgi:glycine/D-amino acid oxidase-like deaminating enzyme